MEYLVTMTTHVPEGTPEQAAEDVSAREAAPSREPAAQTTPLPPYPSDPASRS